MGKGKKQSNENPTAKPAVGKVNTGRTLLDPEPVQISRQEQAENMKQLGNTALANKKYDDAIALYTKAIELMPNHIYYSNRSAAYYEKGQFDEAISDGERCVEMQPEWAKGYSRVGLAFLAKGLFSESIKAYARGIAIEPTNQALKDGLQQAQEAYSKGVPKNHVIGIDLGTTFSCVGVWENDGVVIIPDEEGRKTTPSIVAFTAGERLVGHLAKLQAASNSANTVYDVKRIIGQRINDEKVVKDIKRFPFQVIAGENNAPIVQVKEHGQVKQFAPEEISAMVLTRMKVIAEKYLKTSVTRAVITVPAYFNDAQRQATKDAGAIAGLEVMRIINEPTAAALAYGLDLSSKSENNNNEDVDSEKPKSRNILIFDLGGGTFDVSILSIEGGIFEVLATGGDTHLGGEDFDDATQDHLIHLACQLQISIRGGNKTGKAELKAAKDELQTKPKLMHRLRHAAEEAKRMLSVNESTKIFCDALIDGQDFSTTLTRAQFEQLNAEPFQRCMDTVKAVLKDAKLSADDISDIVLVGGSTRIPVIQTMLSKHFNGRELCRSINPDEAVAYGAAVQGAILGGVRHASTQDLLLVDVTPISLGIELNGKIFSTIVPRNTPVPAIRTKTYTTMEDNQTAIDVVVYEGERSSTDACNKLGEFKIIGIERAKRGVPQIQVTFEVSAEGILKVSAKDIVTNAQAETTIAPNSGRLNQHQIDQMIADGQRFATEDKKRVEKVEALNDLDTLLYQISDQAGPEGEQAVQDIRMWLETKGQAASKQDIVAKHNEVMMRFRMKM